MSIFFETVLKNLGLKNLKKNKVLADGTRLFGHVPEIAPQAWLHCIYPTLNNEEIMMIEKEIGIRIPEAYKDFLLNCSNGLSIFLDTLNLYGFRKIYSRSIEQAWQPYSIFLPNTQERPKDARLNHLFIGGYNWDGSLLYIDTVTLKVHRSSGDCIEPLNTWNNFELMLLSEATRIHLLFHQNGRQINEDEPTTPSPQIP